MKQSNVKKLAAAGLLCAVAVVGSIVVVFPIFGSKCAPVGVAFCASLLRNLLGTGSILAFPGSMCGALLCGLIFWKTRNLPATLAAEVIGTGIIGGLAAYPLAMVFLPSAAAGVAFYGYVVPFLVSTVAGSILAGILVAALRRSGALKAMNASLNASHG